MNRLLKIIYDVVIGLQYGDEGKGKVSQKLALTLGLYQMSARFNGGPNAGHTVFHEGKKLVLHVVPVGILAGLRVNFIGPGCVVDPVLLKKEVEEIKALGFDSKTIYLSDLVHLITPCDRKLDAIVNGALGTTGKGIGPTYAHKAHRLGLRVGGFIEYINSPETRESAVWDLYYQQSGSYKDFYDDRRKNRIGLSIDDFKEWFDAMVWLTKNINIAKRDFFLTGGEASQIFGDRSEVRILVEGAQAVMLDNTFGTYPFVTSSNCLPSAAPSGIGLPGSAKKGKVIGVFKAYNTRVGSGPFPTELLNGTGDLICEAGKEYGSTTNRERRIGWLDLPDLFYACELAGVDELYMTKVDVLSADVIGSVAVCVSKDRGVPKYKYFDCWSTENVKRDIDINGSLRSFIDFVEEYLGVQVGTISVGQEVDDLVSTRPTYIPQGVVKL